MNEIAFSARPSLASPETTWRVSTGRLFWGHGAEWRSIGLDEVVSVQVFGAPTVTAPYLGGATLARGMEVCVLRTGDGRKLTIGSNHFLSVGQFESRAQSFRPFVDLLLREVAEANPDARFIAGMTPVVWGAWLLVLVVSVLAALLGLLIAGAGLTGGGTWDAVIGLVFLVGSGATLVSVWKTVTLGRPRPFDRRPA